MGSESQAIENPQAHPGNSFYYASNQEQQYNNQTLKSALDNSLKTVVDSSKQSIRNINDSQVIDMSEEQSYKQKSVNQYTVDDIINYIGWGKYQILMLIYALLVMTGITMLVFITYAIAQLALCDMQDVSPKATQFVALAQFVGMALGSFSWGFLSDFFGRSLTCASLSVYLFVFQVINAAPRRYWALILIRFFVGFGAGSMPIAFSFFLEVVPKKGRVAVLLLSQSGFIFGEILGGILELAIVPWTGRHSWKYLILASAFPFILSAGVYPILLESPRWLLSCQRYNQAQRNLQIIAKLNNKKIPQDMLDSLVPADKRHTTSNDVSQSRRQRLSAESKHGFQKITSEYADFGRIVKQKKYLVTFCILCFCWFAVGLTYFGMAQIPTVLSVGRSPPFECIQETHQVFYRLEDYTDQIYQSLSCLAAIGLAIGLLMTLQRRLSFSLCMGFNFIALIIQSVLNKPEYMHFRWQPRVSTAFQYLARDLSFGTLTIVYLYTPECFPTKIRGQAVGLVAACTRIGSIISPIVVVGLVQQGKSQGTFGFLAAFAVASSIIVNFIPIESKGKNLTELHGQSTQPAQKSSKKSIVQSLRSLGQNGSKNKVAKDQNSKNNSNGAQQDQIRQDQVNVNV